MGGVNFVRGAAFEVQNQPGMAHVVDKQSAFR